MAEIQPIKRFRVFSRTKKPRKASLLPLFSSETLARLFYRMRLSPLWIELNDKTSNMRKLVSATIYDILAKTHCRMTTIVRYSRSNDTASSVRITQNSQLSLSYNLKFSFVKWLQYKYNYLIIQYPCVSCICREDVYSYLKNFLNKNCLTIFCLGICIHW